MNAKISPESRPVAALPAVVPWPWRHLGATTFPSGAANRSDQPATITARILTLLLGVCVSLVVSVVGAQSASAEPEYNASGPAGTVRVSLRPFGQEQLALSYDFVNTQGAVSTEITLTPVGLNADPSTQFHGGNHATGMVIYQYVEGEQVSVGLHVVFLTPHGVQDNSAKPIVVSYPE